jgi:hypothetical protein
VTDAEHGGDSAIQLGDCVLAGRKELTLAARLNPDLARRYLDVEQRVGHTIKADLSMAQIVADASAEPMEA